MDSITVHRWPACGKQLAPKDGLIVIAVDTPPTPIRDAARKQVREVARQILGCLINRPAGSIELLSSPGQGVRVAGHDDIHLSISHESGLSLMAINQARPVGIDLLRLPAPPLQQPEIAALARDYLGPHAARRLLELATTEQASCFADYWVRHEASLKCLGLRLTEWHAVMEKQLAACQVSRLALPAGLTGAVATRAAGSPAA